MIEKADAAPIIVGIGAGVADVAILREYVDKKRTEPVIPRLKGFGEASALGGIITGVAATIPAVYSIVRKKGIKSGALQAGLLSFGVSNLTFGILSGIFPVRAIAPVGLALRRVTTVPMVKGTQAAAILAPSTLTTIPIVGSKRVGREPLGVKSF